MRVLVTGGAGFIGSALVRHLVSGTEHEVLNYDKLTYAGSLRSLEAVSDSSRHKLVVGDICDAPALRETFEQFRPQAVVHLAAETHVDRSLDGPAQFIKTNVVGTFEVLSAATQFWVQLSERDRRGFRFHQVSTDEVFGSLGPTGVFTECTPYDPRSPYSASKASSDHLVRAWHHSYGLPTLVSNCSNNYGPYQFPEKLVPLMISKAIAREPLPIYGLGENIRDWLYVEDHVRALQLILEGGRPGHTYMVGGNSERSNLEVVRAICALLDELRPDQSGQSHLDRISFVADRPGHDIRYAVDASKLRHELGWEPQETFETGLRRTVKWYLEHEPWLREIQDRSYRGERLGLTTLTDGRRAWQ